MRKVSIYIGFEGSTLEEIMDAMTQIEVINFTISTAEGKTLLMPKLINSTLDEQAFGLSMDFDLNKEQERGIETLNFLSCKYQINIDSKALSTEISFIDIVFKMYDEDMELVSTMNKNVDIEFV